MVNLFQIAMLILGLFSGSLLHQILQIPTSGKIMFSLTILSLHV